MKKNNLDSLSINKECVYREIYDANIYYKLLFSWINGILLENKKFYINFGTLFHHISSALEARYIFALAKIFASTQEESLWKLIIQARKFPERIFNLRLEREPDFIHDEMIRQRTLFIEKSEQYIAKIKQIEKKISPLRNIQRAHNYPFRTSKEKSTWEETKDWINFAEEVFVNVMDSVCESRPSPGDFIPDSQLETDIKYFISLIKEIELK